MSLSSLGSVAQWFPDREKHRCGYCKNPAGSISYGMWTEILKVEDYQHLIDRGWRRSGKYCYKPIMDQTCCPQYTIRCNALDFQLSKSHKKVIKKFNKFVTDGIINKSDIPHEGSCSDQPHEMPIFSKSTVTIDVEKLGQKYEKDMSELEAVEPKPSVSEKDKSTSESNLSCHNSKKLNEHHKNTETQPKLPPSSSAPTIKPGSGADVTKPPCKKAKLLRLERKKEKMKQKGMEFQVAKKEVKQKTLEEFIEEIPDNTKHKLKLQLIPTSTPSVEWENMKNIEFELYKKYQMIVHNDPPEKLSMKGFTNFLVNSPLQAKEFPGNAGGPGYGSFHQQYWIDDKLIAVGVIDILPKCISSVYFFYDPDYRSLALGTYGTLRELYFTRSLQKKVPNLQYYYMGFYIHNCPKMRYKGKLVPSFLACPETYVWVPIEKCLPKLDESKYSRLNDDIDAIDENSCSSEDVGMIKVVSDHTLYLFKRYVKKDPSLKKTFELIGRTIGRHCASSIVFWID